MRKKNSTMIFFVLFFLSLLTLKTSMSYAAEGLLDYQKKELDSFLKLKKKIKRVERKLDGQFSYFILNRNTGNLVIFFSNLEEDIIKY